MLPSVHFADNITSRRCVKMIKESNYYKRLNKGLCGSCGQRQHQKGKKHCLPCSQYSAEKSAALRDKRMLDGICRQCGLHKREMPKSCCKSCLKIQRDKAVLRRVEVKLEVISAYGGLRCSCPKCEFHSSIPYIKFATLDHINGGGNAHRREINIPRGGSSFYGWIKRNKYPPGFQVQCWNCNSGAGQNGGLCPHISTS